MIETFGSSMFFMASAMHLAIIVLMLQPELMRHFLPERPALQKTGQRQAGG